MQDAKSKFWSRVDMRGPDRCWIWTGPTDEAGYGRSYKPGFRTIPAHRVAWMWANGAFPPIPKGQRAWVVMHKCDNPPCCNPAHLQLGTYADNSRDMSEKGRWGPRDLPKGEAHGNAKLTDAQVIEIRRSAKSHVELAALYGVSPGAIEYARQDGWKHIKVRARKPVNGKSAATRGASNANARLTDDDIRAIRASTEKPGKVAARFGIIPDYVTKIRKREVWKHVQ